MTRRWAAIAARSRASGCAPRPSASTAARVAANALSTPAASTASTLGEAGRIFVDPQRYADVDGWHAVARRLRREDPIHRVEAEGFDAFWAITRHRDIVEIERQHDRFWNTMESVLRVKGALEQA